MAVNPDPCWPQHRVIADFVHGPNAEKYIYRHQVEALCEVERHFKDNSKPNIALVVLPTGCGKTGVAVLAPYLLNPSRVLVITPSSKISQQIYEEFCGEDMFLFKRKVIKHKDIVKFRPLSSGNYIKKSRDIERNLQSSYSLMVVNAHKIGGNSRVKIEDIPNDCFDLVIVDEAHHYPAPTWKDLVDHFPNSRRLFLTATPYYKKEHILPDNPPCFSLSRKDAEARGIIRPVDFHEATAQSYPGMTSTEV